MMRLQSHGTRIAHMSGGFLPDAPEEGRESSFELELHFHERQAVEHSVIFVTLEVLDRQEHILVGGLVYVASDEPLSALTDDELAAAVTSSGLQHVAYDLCALVARQMKGTLGFDLLIEDFTLAPTITIDRAGPESEMVPEETNGAE